MATKLPPLTLAEFAEQIRSHSPRPLVDPVVDALYRHYQELRRWNERLALIGPGTTEEVVSRHYGEALAALPLLEDLGTTATTPGATPRHELVDLGSGAGFPGLVLAAARPDIHVTLVESRQRKCLFLETALRKARLPCTCLDARVGDPLPAGIPAELDVVTLRAIRLPTRVLDALGRRLPPRGRFLLWVGEENPDPPASFVPGRTVHLSGSQRRRILELRRESAKETGQEVTHPP